MLGLLLLVALVLVCTILVNSSSPPSSRGPALYQTNQYMHSQAIHKQQPEVRRPVGLQLGACISSCPAQAVLAVAAMVSDSCPACHRTPAAARCIAWGAAVLQAACLHVWHDANAVLHCWVLHAQELG
jgi:hypothetical protein